MDILAQQAGGGGGAKSSKDAELAKVMFEGTQQYRKKLKFPELSEAGEKIKQEAEDESYFAFMEEDKVGRYYFCRFVQDVHPAQGSFMLQCGRYMYSVHEKRKIAQILLEEFMPAVNDIWSGESAETIIEAYEAGKKPQPKTPGKKSARQNQKANKIKEAERIVAEVTARLVKGTPPDLIDEMWIMIKSDCEDYYSAFKRSKWFDMYARARQMETQHVVEEDFHQFRVLGVGGFGSVYAALKKDSGILLAIKRMDKKLIKHKNRYKSCFTEFDALKAMSSPFVCGLHYTFQTKDDVCLVLDLLHGGTLSFLLHQRKRVSERYVAFFSACIIKAYEALHTQGFVYRDMKPANVLIKENGYCVLIDFGLAAKITESALKGKCGTRGYWAPEMVKGNQYLASGDWWSLGVTLVELLTGKKPFKKKFQKYKNTDDKLKICKAGQIEDDIEEKNIEAKLGKALHEDDDGRDSNEEETDEEEEEEAAKKNLRRSSVRVIGGFDKTVESVVDTDTALEFMDTACVEGQPLAAFKSAVAEGATDGSIETARLVRLMSVVTFEPDVEVMKGGEYATFLCVVLEGKLRGEDGREYKVGSICGYEGLFKDNYHRAAKVTGGLTGGTIGIFLYAEMVRAALFDEEAIGALKTALIGLSEGATAEGLDSILNEFAEMEDTHAEERFIASCKHTAKAEDAAVKAEKEKALSQSKQRDQKIYLTQEVWCKKELVSGDTRKFLSGLLTRNVNQRLGCGPGGFQNIKEADFFETNNIDWDKLEEGTLTAPYIPKRGVNAKDEGKMKTFNTAGMKKLNKEDQEKWNEWDWTSVEYYRPEMAAYLHEQWGMHEYRKGGGLGGGGGGGGCCEIS